jgi:hypothetical protein
MNSVLPFAQKRIKAVGMAMQVLDTMPGGDTADCVADLTVLARCSTV